MNTRSQYPSLPVAGAKPFSNAVRGFSLQRRFSVAAHQIR